MPKSAVAFMVLLLPLAAAARPVHVPLDPASLGGSGVFNAAEEAVGRAAQAAGLAFTADPRPLAPRVIETFDTAQGSVRRRDGVLVWRGDMLPDQLAPAESGLLIRKQRNPDGSWATLRTLTNQAPAKFLLLVPAPRQNPPVVLPARIIETPYRLGTIGDQAVQLILWRTVEEGRPPLGGAIALEEPSPALIDALDKLLPPFADRAAWASEFNALAP
jgi:hypothetical protein